MYLTTWAVSRPKAKIKHIKHIPDGRLRQRPDRKVLYLQPWLRKNQDFFHRGREDVKGKRERKGCESRTCMLKNSELFPTNLALYISLSLILVFNLKSARNRWVAPFLSLHKVPALSSFPSRRIPLFLSYFPPIHLHQRTFTRHRVGWQRSGCISSRS